MTGYIVQRLALFVPTLFLVSLLIFGLMRIVPGDVALAVLGEDPGTFTQEDLDEVRKELGLDKPLAVQYGTWVGDVFKGNFGQSFYYQDQSVAESLKRAFPRSMELAVLALVISYLIAIPLGVLSAVKQDSWVDYVSKLFTIGGVALPTSWVAILVLWILVSYFKGALPPLRYVDLWDDPLTNLHQVIFAALALGYFNIAFATRITRSSMLEVLREDYIRTARSKGLAEAVVIVRHALKNAFLPVLTVAGFQFSRLIGGAVLVEFIFLIPGMGSLLIDGVNRRDYPMVQSIVLVVAGVVLVVNLIIDLLYAWINPRIRYA